jgi:hypothetical protein
MSAFRSAPSDVEWLLVVLMQGKWTRVDSWFATVFASAVMAMVIDHYVNQIMPGLILATAPWRL